MATLEHDDVVGKRTAIFAKYRSSLEEARAAEGLCTKWESVVIRVKPERIVTFDYAKASLR